MGDIKDIRGVITDLQRFSMHDGPGIRTTVFLKGCPLRCLWCHNPETQQALPQVQLHSNRCLLCGACAEVCLQGCHQMKERHLFDSYQCIGCFACTEACMPRALEVCGKEVTVEQALREVEKDRAFYGNTGGMTLSGGEPMGQPEFALALLGEAKKRGISTCIETCGAFPSQYLSRLSDVCDLFYYDVKDTDPERHRQNTGGSLPAILENLSVLSALAPGRITMRCIILRGINDNQQHLRRLLEIADQYHIQSLHLLPFHPMGSGKYAAVGRTVPQGFEKERIPAHQVLEEMRRSIEAHFSRQHL